MRSKAPNRHFCEEDGHAATRFMKNPQLSSHEANELPSLTARMTSLKEERWFYSMLERMKMSTVATQSPVEDSPEVNSEPLYDPVIPPPTFQRK